MLPIASLPRLQFATAPASQALLRIKMFVGSRPAFIIPGRIGREEVDLSVALGIPLFAPPPKVVDKFTLRTKKREFLKSTQVNMPPGIELPKELLRPAVSDSESDLDIDEEDEEEEEEVEEAPADAGSGEEGQPGNAGDEEQEGEGDAGQEGGPEGDRVGLPKAQSSTLSRAALSKSGSTLLSPRLSEIHSMKVDGAPVSIEASGASLRHPQLSRLLNEEGISRPSEGTDSAASVSALVPHLTIQTKTPSGNNRGTTASGERSQPAETSQPSRTTSRKLSTRPSVRSTATTKRSAASRPGTSQTGGREDPVAELRSRYRNMPASSVLAYELAMMVVQHTSVERWIFKLNDESNGRGFAFLDLGALEVLQRVINRIQFDPIAMASKTVDMYAVRMVADALDRLLPRSAVVAAPEIFETWDAYAEAFVKIGGVIEASASLVVGSPYASLVILPNGEVRVMSSHELIFCPAYRCIGSAFPQSSVPHGALADAAAAVGAALYREGVLGHVGVSFAALRDGGMLRLWVIDVDLEIRSSSCGFRLFDYLAAGEFNPRTGAYYIHDELQGGPAHPLFDMRNEVIVRAHCLLAAAAPS